MQDIYKGTTVYLFAWSPITGGSLTGDWSNQSLHQSLSYNSNSDSWCDTYCCPCLMGGPLSASIKGDTHHLRLYTLKDPAVTHHDQCMKWQWWQKSEPYVSPEEDFATVLSLKADLKPKSRIPRRCLLFVLVNNIPPNCLRVNQSREFSLKEH